MMLSKRAVGLTAACADLVRPYIAQRQAEVAHQAEMQAAHQVRLRLQQSLAAHAKGRDGFVHACIH